MIETQGKKCSRIGINRQQIRHKQGATRKFGVTIESQVLVIPIELHFVEV